MPASNTSLQNASTSRDPNTGEPIRFPHAWLYLLLVGLLLLLSVFDLSIQSGDAAGAPPKVSLAAHISPVTVMLFVAAWIPLLLPELRNWIQWLRGQGVEEVDLGPVKVTLAKLGLDKVAEHYEDRAYEREAELPTDALARQLDSVYHEAAALQKSVEVGSQEALELVDRLGAAYDQVRTTLPRGQERTRTMGNIAALMWTLMPYTDDFPAGERLLGALGGKRLSAYKFLEWQPTAEFLDTLLARAIGIEEDSFGQYNALLALRRLVAERELTPEQRQRIRHQLEWYLTLNFTGRHRRKLMQAILVQLLPNRTTANSG